MISAAPLIVWRFIDGKPGHEKQSLGLTQAIGRLTGVQCHDIDVKAQPGTWLNWLLGRYATGENLPAPDLLIGAGHATHLPMLAARRGHGGRIVVLMRPSLPLRLFDLCLIPEHDSPRARDNVIATRGALNAVQPTGNNDPSRGLLLIGGPSAHYGWDDHAVAAQVMDIAQRTPDIQWQLTTSRRTPASFIAKLPPDPPANLTILPHTETPAGWLEGELTQADICWVSEDSVSMLYEALTAGCTVGLLQLPGQGDSRVSRGIKVLIADKWVTPYEAWQNSRQLTTLPGRFDEAGRCARLILEKWPQIIN